MPSITDPSLITEDMQHEHPWDCVEHCKACPKSAKEKALAHWTMIEVYCRSLIYGALDKLNAAARLFVQLDRETAERHAEDPQKQEKNPVYCVIICQVISAKTSGSKKVHWVRLEAYCLGLAKRTRALTPAVRQFINLAPGAAEVDAKDPRTQKNNPLYCIEICQIFAEAAFNQKDYKKYASWKSLEAYCLALLKDSISRLIAVAQRFVKHDQQLAEAHAQDKTMQSENPLYCAIISYLLTKTGSSSEHCFWKAQEAYCFALAKDQNSLLRAAECFVDEDPTDAAFRAKDPTTQQDNPLFCAVLYTLLANKCSRGPEQRDLVLKAMGLFILDSNCKEFKRCFLNLTDVRYQQPKPFNIWHALMSFLAKHYKHRGVELIVEHLVAESECDPLTLEKWAETFTTEDHACCWNGFSLWMDTLYYHWEELEPSARSLLLGHLGSLLPLLSGEISTLAWTAGVSFKGRVLDTPLRLLRLLLNKAPEDPALIQVLMIAIKHAPEAAWFQVVSPEEGPVYTLFKDLEGPLQQAFQQHFTVPTTGLAEHSVFSCSEKDDPRWKRAAQCLSPII